MDKDKEKNARSCPNCSQNSLIEFALLNEVEKKVAAATPNLADIEIEELIDSLICKNCFYFERGNLDLHYIKA